MTLGWGWDEALDTQANYGNPNSWTIRSGIDALGREAAQNSVDARLEGERASMTFTIIRLRASSKLAFEEALGWQKLREHLDAMASIKGQVWSDRIGAALEHYDQADELILLRISDEGCRGLTGPELTTNEIDEADYGNFIKLCRLDLFSGKAQGLGGSFGLGKAVYWRFSRTQTALFCSSTNDGADGKPVTNRVFGVNQGTVHRVNDQRWLAKGWFGATDQRGRIVSTDLDQASAQALHLDRTGLARGTSALVVGFHDPDQPDADVETLRSGIEDGLERNFWPLISRGRMEFKIEVLDVEEDRLQSNLVEPSQTYTELCAAIKKYDSGDIDERLEKEGDVVTRDIKIPIPARKKEPRHEGFEHTAKLVVTLSDHEADDLENQVCLFRGPEMLVETISDEIPDQKFHAFLAAGRAVAPESTEPALRHADDYFRLAEPPSHDSWNTTRSSNGHSLAPNYETPYLSGLREIPGQIRDALREIFEVAPRRTDEPPESILKHLKLLRGGAGSPTGKVMKPVADLTAWKINDDKAWEVLFNVQMRGRDSGWVFRPELVFLGADGRAVPVEWRELEVIDGCELDELNAIVRTPTSGHIRCSFRGVTDPGSHPLPARNASIDVRAAKRTHAPTQGGASE